MRLGSAGILFIIFAVLQFIVAKKTAHKVLKFLPMLLTVIGAVIVLALILIGQNAYATLYFIAIGISFIGSIVGLVLASIKKN